MWLKIIIIVLFLGLVFSLFSSFAFLIKDQQQEGSRRTWNTLSLRLMLAGLLIAFIFYGVFTGKLGSNAPWDARYKEQLPSTQPEEQ